MKKRILAGMLLLICLVMQIIPSVYAGAEPVTIKKLETAIDSIVSWEIKQSGAKSLKEWVEEILPESAGTSSADWLAVSLSQYSMDVSFEPYRNALENYIEHMDSRKGTDYQRAAIALSAFGEKNSFIRETIETKAGSLGIMSYVYALILMDTKAYENETVTRDEIIKQILSLQTEDGGWALSGKNGDVDITAMTIQSLALYKKEKDVNAAIKKALNLLSRCQSEDGDYKSYGTANAESTAQVLLALSSLRIDWQNNSRFQKNGHTVLDGLMKYQKKDGSFSHTYQGNSDGIATVQAMYSMIAAWRAEKGMTSLYRFTEKKAERGHMGEKQSVESQQASKAGDAASSAKGVWAKVHLTGKGIKGILLAVIFWTAFVLIVRTIWKRQFRWQKSLVILLLSAVLAGYVGMAEIQTKEEYASDVELKGGSMEITMSIQCNSVSSRLNSNLIPKNGIILKPAVYEIPENASVMDALCFLAKKNQIVLDYTGSQSTGAYVNGIQDLYESDFGSLSGWMYQVNGEFPNVSCNSYKLKKGDTVNWVYTTNMGKDVEQK